MSRSIHTTYKDIKGLTKKELEEQFNDTNSNLAKLGYKRFIKKSIIKQRKQEKK